MTTFRELIALAMAVCEKNGTPAYDSAILRVIREWSTLPPSDDELYAKSGIRADACGGL